MKIKIFMTILFLIVSFYVYQSFMINLSPSEPLGIYKISKNKEIMRGDIVAVCLSPKWQAYGLARNYLLPGIRCHGSAALIKTVLAIPGDTVILNDNTISVNNKTYFYKTLKFDSKYRPLKIFPRGIYENTEGYWLIGTNDPKSWDSRYWGPVSLSQIFSKYALSFIAKSNCFVENR